MLILCSSFCLWVGMCQKWNLINFIFTSLLLTALYTNKTYSFIIRFFKDFKAFLFITGFYCGSLKSPSAFETKCPESVCLYTCDPVMSVYLSQLSQRTRALVPVTSSLSSARAVCDAYVTELQRLTHTHSAGVHTESMSDTHQLHADFSF